jgi:cysteine desulfurase family protein
MTERRPIYFDNAATSWPKPAAMMKAMAQFNDTVGANPGRSGHRLSVDASRAVYDARELIALLINAPDPLSVVFTKNVTEALNCTLLGLLKPGDHIITSAMEHNSVMRPLRFLERQGLEVSVVPSSGAGGLDPDDARRMMKKTTTAIIVTHASNVTGGVLPVEALAGVAHDHGALFILDAAQTAGNVPIDVISSAIDILCFTGHKSLMGPQGTGGFYVREGIEGLIAPLMRGGTGSASEFEEQPGFMPDRFESGTPNAIGIAGVAAGVRFVLENGVREIRKKEMALTSRLLQGVRAIPGAVVYGPGDEAERTSVVSFNVTGMSPSDVALELDERFSILSRPGLHCAPAAHHSIGTFPEGTVRFSFGYHNTEEEVDTAIEALEAISREQRAGKGGC